MHKENSGLAILNSNCADIPHKTVIVLGVPRGGTSMVTGVLTKLGVFTGGETPFYENSKLDICSDEKNKTKAKKIIAGFNHEYPVWGMKIMPKSWKFWFNQGIFREPVYIVVFRDLLAIANRQVVSLDKSLLTEMFKAVRFNFFLLVFLVFNKRPALIISYEKAILFPESLVEGVSAFLGISNNAAGSEEAIKFIKPSPADYVMRSTTHCRLDIDAHYFGYLDIVDSTQASGWVLSVLDNDPVKIELLVNGQYKQATTTSIIRKDVQEKDARFHENCGFVFNFEEQNKLNKGDCIEVRIIEKNIHLINSPYVVT